MHNTLSDNLATGAEPAADAIARGRALLIDLPWLRVLPLTFRTAFFDAAHWINMPAGATITRVDDDADGFYGIAEGAVAMLTALAPPDASVGHIFHPGDWFGTDGVFLRRSRTATMTARLPTLLAYLSTATLEALGTAHPEGWRHIALFGARGTYLATNVAADLMITDSRRRALATLLRQAGARFATPDRRPLIAPISQSELAAMAAMSRNSTNTILRRAEGDGQVALGYGTIEVIDADALRWIVDEG